MNDSDLRERLTRHAEPAPSLGFTATDVVTRGRAARRRRRASLAVATTAVLAAAVVTTATLVPGDGEADSPTPRSPEVAVDGAPDVVAAPRLATSPADLPRVLRALAAQALPGATETLMRPSSWTMRPRYVGLPLAEVGTLPLDRADEATGWSARFDRGSTTLALLSYHDAPDEPRSVGTLRCEAETDDYTCELRGEVLETWTRVSVPGTAPRREHQVIYHPGDTTRIAMEIVRDTGTDPLKSGFGLSSDRLEAIATDDRMTFPLPSPAPGLPSIDNCLFSFAPDVASPDCP